MKNSEEECPFRAGIPRENPRESFDMISLSIFAKATPEGRASVNIANYKPGFSD